MPENQYGKEQPTSMEKLILAVMNAFLKVNGIKMQYVGNGYGNFSENDRRIILMTYHSAKGLDFDNVFIHLLITICISARMKVWLRHCLW